MSVMRHRTRRDETDLMSRCSDGVDITLLWDRRTGQLSVELVDRRRGTVSSLDVAPDRARYAFEHPYAYAQEQRIGRLAA